jgi:hypothetical protein
MGTITTGKLVLTNTTGNQDAFDRLRVSNPTTLFELHHVFGKMPKRIDELTSGSGASTHNSTNSYVQMAVTDSGVGKVVRQSYEYIPYQPGKSRLMLFTGVLETSGGVSGATSRIGCFDDSADKSSVAAAGNGLFFELTSDGIYVVIRLNNTDTKVLQSAWNTDVFDGNGDSGLTVSDFSKAMIFGIDQEWLGVGTVRFGFFINGQFRVGHVFNNSGIGTPSSTAIVYPYTKMGKMPIRYEISSSSAVNAEMRMICSTVISEGGYDPTGDLWSISSTSSVTISSTSTWAPIISLRLRESDPLNRGTIILTNLSVLNTAGSSNFLQWRLVIVEDDSKLTDESFANVSSNSMAQVDNSATAIDVSNAFTVTSGFADIKGTIDFNFDKYMSSPIINSDISGKSRIFSLVAIKTNNNVTAYGALNWLEIR